MAYDPKAPPALLANGIGGATGLRHYAYRSTTDSVATVLGAGYISNARKLGMRVGDALRFIDPEMNSHHLQISAITESGAGTLEFPGVAIEAIDEADLEAALGAYLVGYQDGVQVRFPAEQVGDILTPVVTQAEAEAGAINTGRMTPLRTAQQIDIRVVPITPEMFGAGPAGSSLIDEKTILDDTFAAAATLGRPVMLRRLYYTSGNSLAAGAARGLTIVGNSGASFKRGYPNQAGFAPTSSTQSFLLKVGDGSIVTAHEALTLDGVTFFGADATISKALLWLDNASQCKALKCVFRRARGPAVYANKAEDFIWDDCNFSMLGNSDGRPVIIFGAAPSGSPDIGSNVVVFKGGRVEFIDGPMAGTDPSDDNSYASIVIFDGMKFEVGAITVGTDGPVVTYGANGPNYPMFDFRSGSENAKSIFFDRPLLSRVHDCTTVFAVGDCDDFIVNGAILNADNAPINLFKIESLAAGAVNAKNVVFRGATARSYSAAQDTGSRTYDFTNRSRYPISFEYPRDPYVAGPLALYNFHLAGFLPASEFASRPVGTNGSDVRMVTDPDPVSNPCQSVGKSVVGVFGPTGGTLIKLSADDALVNQVAGLSAARGGRVRVHIRAKIGGTATSLQINARHASNTSLGSVTLTSTTWTWVTRDFNLPDLTPDLRLNSGTIADGEILYIDGFRIEPLDYIDVASTLNPPSISAGAVDSSLTITVTGAAVGDAVVLLPPASLVGGLQGIHAWGDVTAADTVTVYLKNETAGAIDLISGSWRARVYKR